MTHTALTLLHSSQHRAVAGEMGRTTALFQSHPSHHLQSHMKKFEAESSPCLGENMIFRAEIKHTDCYFISALVLHTLSRQCEN